ncbi:MAG: trypsin-like peptidase domain-containing protein, partial [Acidimicrobiales bacterium]
IIPLGPLRVLDRSAGAVVGVLGVLVAVWLLIPSMAEVPGGLSRQARGSVIGRWVEHAAPSSPNTLQALRRLVGADNFPQVFSGLAPSPVVGPPPTASGLSPALSSSLALSTVKVEGTACNRIQEGSGFAVATDLIVTNAHVVAGESRTYVAELNGRRLPATVVAFDPNRDIALLSVPGLGETPLPLTKGRVGDSGAVLGHPNGQDQLDEAPALIKDEVQAVGRDLYGRHTTKRDVFILASQLFPGDSGGALVNTAGMVMGIAFAIAPDQPGTSYALADTELRAVLGTQGNSAVSTGPCLSS